MIRRLLKLIYPFSDLRYTYLRLLSLTGISELSIKTWGLGKHSRYTFGHPLTLWIFFRPL